MDTEATWFGSRPLTQTEAHQFALALEELFDLAPAHDPGPAEEYIRTRVAGVRNGTWGEAGVERFKASRAQDSARQRTEVVPDAHQDQRAARAALYAQLRKEGAL